jgi:hypothetical protein
MVLVKAVYVTDVVKNLRILIAQAKTNTRPLKYIEVTIDEYRELLIGGHLHARCSSDNISSRYFNDVQVVMEGEEYIEPNSLFDSVIENTDYDSEQVINKIDTVKVGKRSL